MGHVFHGTVYHAGDQADGLEVKYVRATGLPRLFAAAKSFTEKPERGGGEESCGNGIHISQPRSCQLRYQYADSMLFEQHLNAQRLR